MGESFSNSILAGKKLTREAIESPAYVAGTQGWSIKQDGTVEFSQATIRGTIITQSVTGNAIMSINTDSGSPALIFNPARPSFLKDGSLISNEQGLGSFTETILTGPSDTLVGTNDAHLTITSGLKGSSERGGISLSAETLTFDAPGTVFVPAWTASTTAPSFGNSTVNGRYWDFGPLAFFRLHITFGSTATYGSGAYAFSLPFTTSGAPTQTVAAHGNQTAVSNRYGGSAQISGASIARIFLGAGGNAGISSTFPFTWASGDTLAVEGMVTK